MEIQVDAKQLFSIRTSALYRASIMSLQTIIICNVKHIATLGIIVVIYQDTSIFRMPSMYTLFDVRIF